MRILHIFNVLNASNDVLKQTKQSLQRSSHLFKNFIKARTLAWIFIPTLSHHIETFSWSFIHWNNGPAERRWLFQTLHNLWQLGRQRERVGRLDTNWCSDKGFSQIERSLYEVNILTLRRHVHHGIWQCSWNHFLYDDWKTKDISSKRTYLNWIPQKFRSCPEKI